MAEPVTNQSIFPAILASTVHDIKNSLGLVLESIRRMAEIQPPGQEQAFSQLEFEANRINHSLMQLLVIYKIDISKFGLDIDEYPALDIIQEASAQLHYVSKNRQVDMQIDCDPEQLCYCDLQNIGNALATVLNNALRYTHGKILISAGAEHGFTTFTIEDDGQGYPEHLLSADFASATELDWVKGNTGLGLYFVSVIAGLHANKGKTGFIAIDNRSRLGGARFKLFLP